MTTNDPMDLYVILRRSAWRSPEDLAEAGARSAAAGDAAGSGVRWIRSYVIEESAGALGSVCLYQATGPEAIREHASRAIMPADEILPVADTVVVRPDPEPREDR